MEGNRLRELLKELQSELGKAERLDPESRVLVEQILTDVERVEAAPEEPPPEEALRDLVLKLESEHPRLAAVLGQVGDALARMGI